MSRIRETIDRSGPREDESPPVHRLCLTGCGLSRSLSRPSRFRPGRPRMRLKFPRRAPCVGRRMPGCTEQRREYGRSRISRRAVPPRLPLTSVSPNQWMEARAAARDADVERSHRSSAGLKSTMSSPTGTRRPARAPVAPPRAPDSRSISGRRLARARDRRRDAPDGISAGTAWTMGRRWRLHAGKRDAAKPRT